MTQEIENLEMFIANISDKELYDYLLKVCEPDDYDGNYTEYRLMEFNLAKEAFENRFPQFRDSQNE